MNTIIQQQENQIEWGVMNAEHLEKVKQERIDFWTRLVEENEQGLRNDTEINKAINIQRLNYWNRSDIEILSQEYLRLQEFKAIKDNRTNYKYYTDEANN